MARVVRDLEAAAVEVCRADRQGRAPGPQAGPLLSILRSLPPDVLSRLIPGDDLERLLDVLRPPPSELAELKPPAKCRPKKLDAPLVELRREV